MISVGSGFEATSYVVRSMVPANVSSPNTPAWPGTSDRRLVTVVVVAAVSSVAPGEDWLRVMISIGTSAVVATGVAVVNDALSMSVPRPASTAVRSRSVGNSAVLLRMTVGRSAATTRQTTPSRPRIAVRRVRFLLM